jgi:hypothetical protein
LRLLYCGVAVLLAVLACVRVSMRSQRLVVCARVDVSTVQAISVVLVNGELVRK